MNYIHTKASMNHKDWLDNEYNLWIEALQSSTVDNFKEHPQVKRMLGKVDPNLYLTSVDLPESIAEIDQIGFGYNRRGLISGACLRMVYYALKILEINPKSIVEIGGGVGEFYAILRALGYKGQYYIYDLPEVRIFQRKYLHKVNLLTGLNTEQVFNTYGFCVSFYALGEFDNELKNFYITEVINYCEHGFIIWNPHSGASNDYSAINHKLEVKQENPLTLEGNLEITW